MIKQVIKKTIDLGDGRTITIETGKLAKQADGAVEVRMGNTMLLATVCSAQEAGEGVDFMPLQVEYKERFSAFGRFPGGFTKREGRASDYEILTSRLVDRVLRPLFPENYHADTFVNIMLFSSDGVDMPDALAGLAASAALAVSDIPFNGPISEVRVARIDGKFKINPTFAELEKADMDLMVGATYENIMMVEGEMDEVSEADLLEALKAAHEAIKVHCLVQKELAEAVGSTVKREYCHETNDEELRKDVWAKCYDKAYAIARSGNADKHARQNAFDAIVDEYLAGMSEEDAAEKGALVKRYYHDVEKEAVRRCILDEGIRLDGRTTTQIRPIWCEVDYIPGPHGSAVFTRGETQSLSTVTLGTKLDEKILDDVLNQGRDRFLLHYNFPPFSTGEAKAQRGVGRREIGHGNLANRALKRMIPADYPYVVRVVSDILESNGSSSMATVCAGTLALMDAGVKIKKPVSGIAMGLITDKDNVKYAILSDILGDEDHLGDMDFKIAGTSEGVTAVQMDIKINGLPTEVMARAMQQAREARLHILGIMTKALPGYREELSPYAPQHEEVMVNPEIIRMIIGPGGKNIKAITTATGASIDIDDSGRISIFAPTSESMRQAKEMVMYYDQHAELGKNYNAKVRRILEIGAIVEILPNLEALVHISQLDTSRVEKTEDVARLGEDMLVKVIEINGDRIRASRKAVLLEEQGIEWNPEDTARPQRDRGDRGERGGRERRGDRGDRPRRERRD